VRTPPIMVGGWGPKTFDRVLEYGDGWLPIAGDVDRLAEGVKELRERAGRHVQVTVYATPAKREVVDKLIAAGVDEILLFLPTKPADETLRRLDTMAELIAE
jgi:alkanesulfonate monooxygenase SsuD/methylene tetrahydromethanopterin reductase-like flavin-dependent oxidoreductase (luciferase family)